jgi:lipopolysaccharide transport system permease protein
MALSEVVPAATPLKIRPPGRWSSLDLRELWRFRDLLWVLAGRDVKLRYRQTALGVGWVLLQPLMAAGIFSLVFGVIANLPSEGVPYFIFAYAGLLGWNAFASTLLKSSASMLGNSQLISKVYFPRLVLPLSTVHSSLLDFAIGFALLCVLLLVYGLFPSWPILLLPVWLALMLATAIGLGLMAGALMISYRDVQHILPVVVPFLLYVSPVGYAVSRVPAKLRLLYLINPLGGLLEAFRWSILGVGQLSAGRLAYSTAAAAAVLLGGVVVFKRMEQRFADVI